MSGLLGPSPPLPWLAPACHKESHISDDSTYYLGPPRSELSISLRGGVSVRNTGRLDDIELIVISVLPRGVSQSALADRLRIAGLLMTCSPRDTPKGLNLPTVRQHDSNMFSRSSADAPRKRKCTYLGLGRSNVTAQAVVPVYIGP